VIAEGLCAGLLAQRAGGGFHWAPIDSGWLIAVDPASGRIAGAVTVTGEQHQIGGWLAPQFRGRGLGRELWLGAVTFAHYHLAMATVLAGTERTNAASVGALLSAGFVATTGPARHRLPDGRTVPSQWFRHDTDEPRYCR
jgi:RimJ/RimL family protein N-acetyltransferase